MQQDKMPVLLILPFSLRCRNPSISSLPMCFQKRRGELKGKQSFHSRQLLTLCYPLGRGTVIFIISPHLQNIGDVFLLKVRAFWVCFASERKKAQKDSRTRSPYSLGQNPDQNPSHRSATGKLVREAEISFYSDFYAQ